MIRLVKILTAALSICITAVVTVSCGNDSVPAETAQPAADATLTIAVTGMTCAGCSNAITETLSPIPGVRTVEVDHETGKAVITTNGDADLPKKLTTTITELGFTAALQ